MDLCKWELNECYNLYCNILCDNKGVSVKWYKWVLNYNSQTKSIYNSNGLFTAPPAAKVS